MRASPSPNALQLIVVNGFTASSSSSSIARDLSSLILIALATRYWLAGEGEEVRRGGDGFLMHAGEAGGLYGGGFPLRQPPSAVGGCTGHIQNQFCPLIDLIAGTRNLSGKFPVEIVSNLQRFLRHT